MPHPARLSLALLAVLSVPLAAAFQRSETGHGVRPVTWEEVAAITRRLSGAAPDLDREEAARTWTAWIAARREAIRERLERGELDSVVNLLLFGTSFTMQPRITSRLLEELNERWREGDAAAHETLTRAYRQRSADLVEAMASGSTERLRSGRRTLERLGHDFSSPAARAEAADALLAHVVRVREEAAALAAALEQARAGSDATAAFAAASRVFAGRGLAPDSTVLTQFAVEGALCALAARGTLPKLGVNRLAIVGPGLDFADKQEGFDFYDLQSVQPFTTVDSLQRCGLANAGTLHVTTLDVSERVNAHLRAVRERASAGVAYRIVLPLASPAALAKEANDYWMRAGRAIGTPVAIRPPPSLPDVRARAIAVRPGIAAGLDVLDANVVLDRLEHRGPERFDLVIATNVLLYYDTFEQALAAASIAAMLRPGGVLLTNTSLLEIPEIPLRSEGYLTVRFSDRAGDGEHMVWYRREGN